MKILLFGCKGQVGGELQRSLASLGQLHALSRDTKELCGDLRDLEGISRTVEIIAPDVIVNAAAYTAVDKAETETALAHLVNGDAPGAMATAAVKCGALVVHYSTDYVFDGSGVAPWSEDDETNPLSVYGSSKLAGERAIQQSGCRHLIFRTSWVYGPQGKNFARTMLRLAREKERLDVVDDQIGAPTGADLIANVTAQAIKSFVDVPTSSGLYHLNAAGETSWHGYASFVLNQARQAGIKLTVSPDNVFPVASDAFDTAAQRPLNSRLNTQKLQRRFSIELPNWQSGVSRLVNETLVLQ